MAKEYALTKGSRKGFKVYIYKNGVEIKGSPFDSFRSGYLSLNSASSLINYLDTGKIFKDGYTFYSSSQSKKKINKRKKISINFLINLINFNI